IESVVRAGFENVLVLNGHGGNVAPLASCIDQFQRLYQVNLQCFSYWDLYEDSDAELLDSGRRRPQDLPGHAQEFETSFALSAFPENVRKDMWTDQNDPAPAMATEEKGRQFIERVVDRLVSHLEAMIDGTSRIETPPFHP
ncbi:MAG: creatininase family protein, partial [Planctomycetota bacterium]